MITVIEISGAGKLVATKYFMYNETFPAVDMVYLALVTHTIYAVHLLEMKTAIPGTSH